MTFYIDGKYVAKGSRVANNGKTYYSIAILQGTEPISLGCSQEVYNILDSGDVQELDEFRFRFTENLMNGKNGAFISRFCVGCERA